MKALLDYIERNFTWHGWLAARAEEREADALFQDRISFVRGEK